jgi:FeS assembly SUF system protein
MAKRPPIAGPLVAGPEDPAETEGLTARVDGASDAAAPPDRKAVIAKLRECYDPELPVNLYDLGLIYALDVATSGEIAITMTLTAPGCPVAEIMPKWVARAVAELPGARGVSVTMTWQPAWSKDMMSEDARLALDL